MGVTVGDYDNDGFEDIYVTNWNSAILYHNNGDGTFTDVTEKAGVQNNRFGVGAAFVDYDRDGRLDCSLATTLSSIRRPRGCITPRMRLPGPWTMKGNSSRLFHNNGDGTFTDVSEKSGIANVPGRAMGVTVGDFDNDGWPDIYVANDQMESYLYHNNHDGTFTNVGARAKRSLRHEWRHAFGNGADLCRLRQRRCSGPLCFRYALSPDVPQFLERRIFHRHDRGIGNRAYGGTVRGLGRRTD